MPIECKFPVQRVSQKEFHVIDEVVTGIAFDIHNELGRFCNERIYQDELAHRCVNSGIPTLRELRVCVTHQDFSKQYFLDVLADGGAIYELKAVDGLGGNHEAQAINYLLLTGLNHGKLLNMRPASVEYRYVSTRLTEATRRAYSFDITEFDATSPAACRLYNVLRALFSDWGAFLETQLYHDALIHFMGGEGQVVKPIEIRVRDRVVGRQKVCLLGSETAFHVSAISRYHPSYRKHLIRLLKHTSLQRIHWININGANIELRTLEKE